MIRKYYTTSESRNSALAGDNLLIELQRGAVGILEDAGQYFVALGSAIRVGAHFGRCQDDFGARVFYALEAVAEIIDIE